MYVRSKYGCTTATSASTMLEGLAGVRQCCYGVDRGRAQITPNTGPIERYEGQCKLNHDLKLPNDNDLNCPRDGCK